MRSSRMLLWSSWRMYWRLEPEGGGLASCQLQTKLSGLSAAENAFSCVFFCFVKAFVHKKNNFSLFYFVKRKKYNNTECLDVTEKEKF